MRILDHGYVLAIDIWGSDEDIISAARMSTNKGFLGWGTEENPGDEKLLKYLWTNKHYTPFEMAGLTIEVKAPIFVFREWHRHRTQSYNEMSARYVPLPDENYIPTFERCLSVSTTNKQASAISDCVNSEHIGSWLIKLDAFYKIAQELYQNGLSAGIPKEIARIVLPVGRYSRMRASANLRNWLAFTTLRSDEHAQWEIRQYSHAVEEIIKSQFPRTYEIYAQTKNT